MPALVNRQFVVDASGKPVAVLLDIATYQRLCEAADEAGDIHAFDEALPRALEELRARECVGLDEYLAGRKGA